MRKYYRDIFVDGNGNVLQGATVTVYLAGTSTAATIYNSATTATEISGSQVTTDAYGSFEFYVDCFDYDQSQLYKLVMVLSGYTTETQDNLDVSTIVLQTYTFDTNKTIGSNIHNVPSGVIYKPDNGVSLTFSDLLYAGPYQIFDLSEGGTVSGLRVAMPEWFGAKGDDATVASNEGWQYAVNSLKKWGTFLPWGGRYWFQDSVLVDAKPIAIVHPNPYGYSISPVTPFPSDSPMLIVNGCERANTGEQDFAGGWFRPGSAFDQNGFAMVNAIFEGNDRGHLCHGIVFRGDNADVLLDNVQFFNIKGSAIKACDPYGTLHDDATGNKMQECVFKDVEIKNCGYDSGTYATSHASLEIGRNAEGSGAHNNLRFHGRCVVAYSRWIGVRILNVASGINMHEIKFDDLWLHGNDAESGDDENGEAWLVDEDLMVIGNRPAIVAETDNVGLIKTVFIKQLHMAEIETGRSGIYVGSCIGAHGASVSISGGDFGGGTLAYGITFDGANASYVGGVAGYADTNFQRAVHIVGMESTSNQVHLGDCAEAISTAADGREPMIVIDSPATKDDINDNTVRTFTLPNVPVTTGTDAQVAVPLCRADRKSYVRRAWLIPTGALTAHDTNYAELNLITRLVGGTVHQTTTTTTKITGGTGDWTAYVPIELSLPATEYLPQLGSISFSMTKAGAGVDTPVFTVMFEISDWRYY